MKPQIIALFAIKGGTAKTTTAAALLQAAAKEGLPALGIDLDPQANLSFCLGADPTQPGALEMLNGEGINIQHSPQGMAIITGSAALATLKTYRGSALRLQEAIKPLECDFPFIVIDTPPTIGECTLNALAASTEALIPLEADAFSLQALYNTISIARQMQENNPRLKRLYTVCTNYNGRARINDYMLDQIRKKGKELGAPLLGTIRKAIAVKEAGAFQRSLFDYAPKSKPAEDYKALFEAVRKK